MPLVIYILLYLFSSCIIIYFDQIGYFIIKITYSRSVEHNYSTSLIVRVKTRQHLFHALFTSRIMNVVHQIIYRWNSHNEFLIIQYLFMFIIPHLPKTQEEEYKVYPWALPLCFLTKRTKAPYTSSPANFTLNPSTVANIISISFQNE